MSLKNTLWVEKYRPDTLDTIVGNDDIVERLKGFTKDSETPNILFAGPQGTGKTAMTVAFAKELYGDEWRSNMLELNASDERGIDTVRDRIKSFARTGVVGDAPFKIVFLDEVDNTTKDAQGAMRRVMEDYSENTRFVLSCNYPNKIIPPVQSRCAVFRVSRLDDSDIERIARRVAEAEDLDHTDNAIDRLVHEANGDARSAVNMLQSSQVDGRLTEDGVESIAGTVSYQQVEAIMQDAISGDLDTAMNRLDVEILKSGASEQKFLEQALSVVKRMDMPEDARAKAISKVADADWRTMQGANPHIQLHSLLSDIQVAYHLALPNYTDDNE